VQKLFDQYSLEEFPPELNWQSGDLKNNESRTLGIIALFLHHRGMYLHVEDWRMPVEDRACNSDTKYFVEARTHIINREYKKAISHPCSFTGHRIMLLKTTKENALI
jgi:hypothetical protein